MYLSFSQIPGHLQLFWYVQPTMLTMKTMLIGTVPVAADQSHVISRKGTNKISIFLST